MSAVGKTRSIQTFALSAMIVMPPALLGLFWNPNHGMEEQGCREFVTGKFSRATVWPSL
jgi:hypothetical protein